MAFPSVNPTQTNSWKKLSEHAQAMKSVHMKNLFAGDASRFSSFSQKEGELLFDYSLIGNKNPNNNE